MKRQNDFDTIFDECLGRVMAGESIETCLADYPEQADELRPLLETVLETREATDITPRQEFKRQAFYDFQAAVRDLPQKSAGGSFSLRHWWATAVAVLVTVIILGGGGTVLASTNSLPDSPLYAVKLATENVRLAFTFSDESKAELYAAFAEERVDEIVAMAEAGDADGVNLATENLDRQLIAMANVFIETGTTGGTSEESLFSAPETTVATATTTATVTTMEAATATETATVVPSATTTPTAEAEPTPETATSAAEVVTPTIVIPTEEVTAGGGPGEEDTLRAQDSKEPVPEGGEALSALTAENADATGLEQEVLEQAMAANNRILEELDKVSDEVREALLKALEVLNSGYVDVISNMK